MEQLRKIARIVDEGKAQGSIRADIDSWRAAWRLIVFAWAEDIAEMMGIRELISEGISGEILDVLLKDLAADGAGWKSASQKGSARRETGAAACAPGEDAR